MRVLVTGGAGLVGMALRKALAAAGHEPVATDITAFGRADPELVLLPLSDRAGLERLVAGRGVEAIVHSGGISGPVMERNRPTLVCDVNIGSTAALLDIARRHDISRFLLMSSHVVYGDAGLDIIDETRLPHPATTYAASKIAGEALVESFRREFGLSAASLRLTRVYGPFRRANCFLRRILLDRAAKRATVIPCDPLYLYHYLYVEDVASAVLACLAAPELRHVSYNVASGERLTMPAVVEAVRSVLTDARIELVDGVDDAPETQTDFSLRNVKADAGWFPAFPLARGFKAYAEAFARDTSVA